MSEIKVGDTVRIIKPKPCCGFSGSLGEYHLVEELPEKYMKSTQIAPCTLCGDVRPFTNEFVWLSCGSVVQKYRLKKIPPLNELEDQTEERKVEV